MSKYHRLSNVNHAEVISVIQVKSYCGEGTKEDPGRTVIDYFSPSGELLARTEQGQRIEQGTWHDHDEGAE